MSEMQQNHDAPPFNSLPPVVWLLTAALLAAEPFLWLQSLGFFGGIAGIDGRLALIQEFALPGRLQSWLLETGRYETQYLKPYLSYSFVHGSFTQALFTGVFVLALGNMMARVLGVWRFLLLYFVPATCGAIAYGLALDPGAIYGGMPGAFGLIGGFTWLMWAGLVRHGLGALSPFALAGFLLVFDLATSVVFGWRWETLADWAGFVTGFALMFAVIPGAVSRLLKVLRRR